MNLFTKRMALAIALTVTGNAAVQAQTIDPRLVFNGPANITGPKQFNWSYNPTNTTPWGRPIDSVWINVPVVKAFDTLGESLLLNGTGSFPSLVGKFALIHRGGGISFSQKADYCQRAGAIGVIIVNQKNGGTIGMAPTAPFAAATTIPVIIISREDGLPINNAINAGQAVTVSLSNWGFNRPNDLGFLDYSPATPHAFCIPVSQLASGQPRAYNFYNSAFVCNFGNNAQTNVMLKQTISFTPTSGSAATVYTDSVVMPSMPVPLTRADSIQSFESPRFARRNFAGTGLINVNYNLSSTTGADSYPADNNVNYQVYATDSIFCKSHWNASTNAPRVSISYRFGAVQPLVFGPLFYVNKGGYGIAKAQVAIGADSDLLNSNPVPPSVLVYLFKWNDGNKDGLINRGELAIAAVGFKNTFSATDSSLKPVTITMNKPSSSAQAQRVQDTSWYFLAAELEHDFSLGCDNEANFYLRSFQSKHVDSGANTQTEFWAPTFTGNLVASNNYQLPVDTVSMIPFTATSDIDDANFFSMTGLVPSMALHITKNIPTNDVRNGAAAFNKFEVSPNPASTQLNVELSLPAKCNMAISVVNTIGQSLMFKTYKGFQNGKLNINTAQFPAGTYYFVVGTDAGSEVRQFTIAH